MSGPRVGPDGSPVARDGPIARCRVFTLASSFLLPCTPLPRRQVTPLTFALHDWSRGAGIRLLAESVIGKRALTHVTWGWCHPGALHRRVRCWSPCRPLWDPNCLGLASGSLFSNRFVLRGNIIIGTTRRDICAVGLQMHSLLGNNLGLRRNIIRYRDICSVSLRNPPPTNGLVGTLVCRLAWRC